MKVIIVGKGPGWHKAPYEVEDGQIWGVNDVCLRRRVDLAFNMHDLEKHKDHKLFKKTIDHVNSKGIPIVTQEKYDFIPTSHSFPLQKFTFYFNRLYFTNSIDYMVAYACFVNTCDIDFPLISDIEMYGVVMAVGTEYMKQRPSLEYWIGMFEGAWGRVLIHEPTFVCKNDERGLYGYDWDEEDLPHVKARSENQ